jgi:ribonuclease P protein component
MKRQYRLRQNVDFQRVRRNGKFHASPLMVLAFLRNELDYSRFGFVVSKRLGKAVQRNKIKRRLREATRLRVSQIKPGFDLVFIARQPIAEASYTEIERLIERLLKEEDLLTSSEKKQGAGSK